MSLPKPRRPPSAFGLFYHVVAHRLLAEPGSLLEPNNNAHPQDNNDDEDPNSNEEQPSGSSFRVSRDHAREAAISLRINRRRSSAVTIRVLQTTNLSFRDLTTLVASRWRTLSPEERRILRDQVDVERQEYVRSLAAWQETQFGPRFDREEQAVIFSTNAYYN